MTAPTYVGVRPGASDQFVPGPGLPVLTSTPQLVSSQATLDAILAAAGRSGIELRFYASGTNPGPQTSWPYVHTVGGVAPDINGDVPGASGVAANASPAGDPGAPVWKRTLTTALSSTWANLREVWVGSTLSAWLNEWGALRGTSPYPGATGSGSPDALVRAIRTSTDGITGSNSAIEVVDRRTAGQSNTMIGWGWDGAERIGGTAAAPAGTKVAKCVLVNHGAAAPAGLPDGTLIFEKTS